MRRSFFDAIRVFFAGEALFPHYAVQASGEIVPATAFETRTFETKVTPQRYETTSLYAAATSLAVGIGLGILGWTERNEAAGQSENLLIVLAILSIGLAVVSVVHSRRFQGKWVKIVFDRDQIITTLADGRREKTVAQGHADYLGLQYTTYWRGTLRGGSVHVVALVARKPKLSLPLYIARQDDNISQKILRRYVAASGYTFLKNKVVDLNPSQNTGGTG